MLMHINKFKQKLNSRAEVQFGLWLGLADPIASEISAGAGFDWLLIDDEHAPFEIKSILSSLQAIAAYDVHPIIRPLNHDPDRLKKLLDIGVQNFLIPMVNSYEEVEHIVQSLMFPPRGIRGLGTSLSRAAKWSRVTDYVHRANDEICLIIQVETLKAIENLEQILTHDLLDGVFIGPSDLAADMGYLGQPSHPEVVLVVNEALQKISEAKKSAGVLVVKPDLVRVYQEKGATLIGVGTDTGLLAAATQSLASSYIKPNDSDTHIEGY